MANKQLKKVTIGDATLYRGDCIELIPQIEDFHALITDPPYSSGGMWISSRGRPSSEKYTKSLLHAYSHYEVLGDNKDAIGWAFWATLWLSRTFARLPDGAPAIMFSDWRQLPNATNVFQAGGFVWRGIAVWQKIAYRRLIGRFAHQAEYMIWGSKGNMPIDYKAKDRKAYPGVFTHSPPLNGKRQHMTEKPLGLMNDLVQITKEGSTVFDPFMGAATTGVAAIQSGRKFIGIELHPEYFKIACKRLEQAYKDMESK